MTEQAPERQPSTPLWDDALVEEVRATRRRLWEKAGRDIREYVARSREAARRRRNAQKSCGQDAA